MDIFNNDFSAFSASFNLKSEQLNVSSFWLYYSRYSMLAQNRFKWEGLPEGCDVRFLEWCLYSTGKAGFCRHVDMGIINGQVAAGDLNNFADFVNYSIYGFRGEQYGTFNNSNGVLARNNVHCVPTVMLVYAYCMEIAEIDRVISVNLEAQKTPILIECAENEKLTVQNAYKKRAENSPVIFGKKSSNLHDKFGVLKTDAPYLVQDLYTYKTQKENELREKLGIDTSGVIGKKERLLVDEVNSSNGVALENIGVELEARQQACKELKKVFDIDVSVHLKNYEVKNTLQAAGDEGKGEGEENGTDYD